MADNKDITETPTDHAEKLPVGEGRRGSVLFADESKRRASVAQLTANTSGE
jgi:hypothetical protein